MAATTAETLMRRNYALIAGGYMTFAEETSSPMDPMRGSYSRSSPKERPIDIDDHIVTNGQRAGVYLGQILHCSLMGESGRFLKRV